MATILYAYIEPAQVLEHLQRHHGKANGIHVRELTQQVLGSIHTTAAQERRVRDAVSELRQVGHQICGRPDRGYFMADTAEELDETCRYLRDRAMTSLVIESRLRKLSMPELLGQLALEPLPITTKQEH